MLLFVFGKGNGARGGRDSGGGSGCLQLDPAGWFAVDGLSLVGGHLHLTSTATCFTGRFSRAGLEIAFPVSTPRIEHQVGRRHGRFVCGGATSYDLGLKEQL